MKISIPFAAGLMLAAPLAFANENQDTLNKAGKNRITANEFNPAISLILDGRYNDVDNSSDEDELELPGFQLGGEAGLPENGFSTGHNELVISANVDDKFYAMLTTAIVYEDGETELEFEEAYFETLSSLAGFTLKGGKYFSNIGYLNAQHEHAQDFADRPLVYDALFGGNLRQTGLQLSWLAPTDFFLQFGAEVSAGNEYPSGSNEDNDTGAAAFVKVGGDIGDSSSWQLGASYYEASFDEREGGGHDHGGEEDGEEEHGAAIADGDVDVTGVDFVYKWAPNGNNKNTSFTFQTEYFVRNESGLSVMEHDGVAESADYDGEQSGYYAQAVYKFLPQWRVGVRYDSIEADNKLDTDEEEFLEESGLASSDDSFDRSSIMVDWSPSHFSYVRLQFSELSVEDESVDMLTLQYVMSLGSHGAHSF